MSFKNISVNGKPNSYNQKEYLLNNVNDVAKLPRYGIRGTMNNPDDTSADEPCDYGSTAMVCNKYMCIAYMLTLDNVWTKISSQEELSTTEGVLF